MPAIDENTKFKDFELILPSFKCDKNCPYCSAKITKWYDTHLDVQAFKSKLQLLKDNGVTFKYFILSGNGEPSLIADNEWQQIWDIVSEYRKMFDQLRVQTSGHLFYEAEKLAYLPKETLIEITRVHKCSTKDMEELGYKEDYVQTEAFKSYPYIRLNYVTLKGKSAREMRDEIQDYATSFPNIKTISIKTLNLNTYTGEVDNPYSKWILANAFSRNESSYLVSQFEILLGESVIEYKDRRVWALENGMEITLYEAKGKKYGDTHIVFYGDKLVDFNLEEYEVNS